MGTCSDLFCPRAYDSLKDFQDIYEVAALKWKVGALQGVTRQKVPWEGDEARRHPAVPLSPCWDISALSWALCTGGITGGPWPCICLSICNAVSWLKALNLRPH